MSQPIISVRDISKVYRLGEIGATSLREESARVWRKFRGKEPLADEGDFWALNGVSFEVEQGEVVGIIGKNGAGKSTLLKILSRITEPSKGEIRLRGRVAALLEVGTGFHPELTGRENIYLNGTILGMKKREIDAKLDEIINFSGIEKHIDTPVKRYSSGMNVRLGFAVAAHLEPEILIVDEVLAVGDAEFQKKCIEKMQDVASEGRTVLFVSHNMSSVTRLTQRSIVLEKGRVSLDSSTSNAVDYYLSGNDKLTIHSDDVSNRARLPFGNGDITIQKLGFSKPSESIKLGDDIGLYFTYKSRSDLAKVKIQITIHSECGSCIGTSRSENSFRANTGETKDIHIQLPNPQLAPGRYVCDISLLSGDALAPPTAVYEVLPSVLNFEVSSISSINNQVAYWNNAWGPILLPNLQQVRDS